MRGNKAERISTTARRHGHDTKPVTLEQFTIVHSSPDAPGIIHHDIIDAPNMATARRTAERRFGSNAIVRILRQDGVSNADTYPSARFIRGQFQPVSAADEAALFELGD